MSKEARMLLKDVMIKKVQKIDSDATLGEAAEKMRNLNVGALAVQNRDGLCGMITDRDIVVRALAIGADPATEVVANIMSAPVFSCYDDQTLEDAAVIMEEKKIRRLPILDKEKKLVGIVSLSDMAVEGGNEKLTGEILQAVCKR
jgi:CBS domain-containing protein